MHGIKKEGTAEPVCRAAVEAQTRRTDCRARWGREWAGQMERAMWKHTLPHVCGNIHKPVGICCVTQGAQPSALWQPRGVGAGGREAQGGGDICIYVADSC